jgi:predicted unusual protein kinase regulating ubiquinone biosynthesis (AarF/ABC1/UbiB family)
VPWVPIGLQRSALVAVRRSHYVLGVADIPTGRLGRLARLAALGTRATAGKLVSGDANGAALARAAVDTLGSMRGLALKIGQMASYVDGYVPPAYRESFERTLQTLRSAAPAMTEGAAARVVREELGDAPERLFAEWSAAPFAAASIGQVHRARLFDGRLVAVKVQYEDVARAVAADLSNASMLTSLLGPLGSKFAVKEQMGEMRARFEEELDYRHEASEQTLFRSIWQGDPQVRIPEVVAERSGRRVITSELVGGLTFDDACAAPAADRARWVETLWRFVFGSLLRHGLFNADPHPGNYVFAPNGGVYFLDFGCTRHLEARQVCLSVRAHRAAQARDLDAFYATFDEMLHTVPGDHRRRVRSYAQKCFAPLFADGPYRFTRAYTTDLWDELVEHSLAMARGARTDYMPLPAEHLFLNRLQVGFYSVLARLDVTVDYRAIEERLLPRA